MAGLSAISLARVFSQTKIQFDRVRIQVNVGTWISVVVALGIIVRIITWQFDRSLWLDEIYLALNITGRSFAELWRPLDHDQGAPVGFLMLVKAVTVAFGTSEMALRIVPLAGGIGAMVMFPKVARRLMPPQGVLFATALFAFAPKLVYYASELKQYSTDVMITLIMLALAQRTRKSYLPLAVLGAFAIWFSHPAVFILAAIGIVLFGVAFWRNDESSIRGLLYVGMTWAVSFGGCYLLCLRELSKNHYLMTYWTQYFAPFPPRDFEQAGWYLRAIIGVFEGPAGMSVADVSVAMPALMLFAFGWFGLWRRKPVSAACLLAPLILAMAASLMHRYPFGGRLLLFAVPLLQLGMGAAFAAARSMPHSTARTFLLATCAVVMIAPVATTLQQLIRPRPPEDHRAVVSHIARHIRTGDRILLSGMAREPWIYYCSKQGIDAAVINQVRRDDWDSVSDEAKQLAGNGRVWVFIAHERDDNKKMLLWQLDQLGTRKDQFIAPGSAAFLYDLSQPGDFTWNAHQ